MTFDDCIVHVGIIEGKLSLDKNDRGNWTSGIVGKGILKGTKYGISAMSYPYLDIANLTWEKARSIYLKDFWDKYQMERLPAKIRLYFLDSCINHGPAIGIKLLQRSVGAKDDGILGPATLAQSIKSTPQKFFSVRQDFYVDIIVNDLKRDGYDSSSEVRNLKGWLRRNFTILSISLNL